MALKPVVSNLDEVPEALRSEYKPLGDGRFVLDTDVEAHPALTALKNSLANAREERNQAKEALTKYNGIDPTKYVEMQKHEQMIQEGKLIAEGKLEELVALRTTALREDLSTKLNQAQQNSQKLQSDMDKLVIDNAVHAAAAKVGVKKSAMEDVLERARKTFKAKDGQAIAFQGESPVYAKDGINLLGIDEWLSSLPSAAPHLFEESRGSGAPGGQAAPKPVGGPGTINKADHTAFLANLDAIAKGKIKVVQ